MMDHELPTSAHASERESTRPYWLTMVALMVLLAATVAVADVDVGVWNLPVALLIATLKAVLILYIFMHIRGSPPLIWLFAAAGFFWLAILMTLALSDYLTRA